MNLSYVMWKDIRHGLQVSLINNGGDDWNDSPYESNAEEPYDNYYENGRPYPIFLNTLYFETNDSSEKQPCDVGRFSVEEINRGAVAWIATDKYVITAGTTYDEFVKIIKAHGGKIYEEV